MPLPKELIEAYKRMGYGFTGNYGFVKPCHWFKKSLKTQGREFCYKQRFYGVPSHRCLQCSIYPGCSHRCIYCWRASSLDLGIKWDEMRIPEDIDEPEVMLDKLIETHRKIVSGYYGLKGALKEMVDEAMKPVHLTPSLMGEPTLLGAEYLSRFFAYAMKKGFHSIFLVTNGTMPNTLSELEVYPTQLYLSLNAPDEETYRKVCRPIISHGWERILESLEIMSSYTIPTVLRITVIKGFNMHSPEKYAKLIEIANPTYVEVKAAMAVGYFRYRLSVDVMPSHDEVSEFACRIAEHSGYNIIDEFKPSRVVLLSRLNVPIKLY